MKPAFDRIGGNECPICLGLGKRCNLNALIDCVDECDRCEAVVQRRAKQAMELFNDDTKQALGMTPATDPAREDMARVIGTHTFMLVKVVDGPCMCDCGWIASDALAPLWVTQAEHRLHLADALLADGWTKPAPIPLDGSESYPDDKCPEHGPRCSGPTCCCRDKHRPAPAVTGDAGAGGAE